MFSELMPLIQHRPLTLTIAAIDEKQIRVNVIPGKTEKDAAANKKLSTATAGKWRPFPRAPSPP